MDSYNSDNLTCDDIAELFMAYMDNGLTELQLAMINNHNKNCELCRNDFETYKIMKQDFIDVVVEDFRPIVEAPEDFTTCVMAKISAISEERQTQGYIKLRTRDTILYSVIAGFIYILLSSIDISSVTSLIDTSLLMENVNGFLQSSSKLLVVLSDGFFEFISRFSRWLLAIFAVLMAAQVIAYRYNDISYFASKGAWRA